MARSTSATPKGTDVVRIGAFYYPVILRPEYGPQAYEHINRYDGAPVNYTRRYNAVRFLWDQERDDEGMGDEDMYTNVMQWREQLTAAYEGDEMNQGLRSMFEERAQDEKWLRETQPGSIERMQAEDEVARWDRFIALWYRQNELTIQLLRTHDAVWLASFVNDHPQVINLN